MRGATPMTLGLELGRQCTQSARKGLDLRRARSGPFLLPCVLPWVQDVDLLRQAMRDIYRQVTFFGSSLEKHTPNHGTTQRQKQFSSHHVTDSRHTLNVQQPLVCSTHNLCDRFHTKWSIARRTFTPVKSDGTHRIV